MAVRAGVRQRLRALRVDLTPLRTSRDFRILWLAGTAFYLGGMVGYVAVPFQVYHLTGSNLLVGAVGIVELVPLLAFGLWGGAVADHWDRRRVLVVTGVLQVVLTSVLAVNAFASQPHLGVIFVVAGFLAAAGAVQRPSREALLPRTVTHEEIPAANALSMLGMQVGRLAGPTLGGLLLASVGAGWCYTVEVCGLLAATALFLGLSAYPHRGVTTPVSIAGIVEGMRYAVRRRDLLGTYLVDVVCMFLAMPVVLFPALAQEVLRQPQVLGLLYSAETLGAVVASAMSGWAVRAHRHGAIVVCAAAAYGAFIGLAGLAPTAVGVILALTAAGAADMVSGMFRGILWNQTIPETMRGRLAGIEMLSYSVGPLGGQVRAGFVADRWSVRGSIASGGAACVVGVLLTAVWLRDFWRYDNRTDPYALAERAARGGAPA